jgi:hypothetical protein
VAESVQIGDLHKDLLPRVGSQLSGEKRIADTFCDLYQNKLIYTPGRHWMKFNGSYWENCDGDVEVWRAMEKVCSYLLTAASCTEDPERGELIGLVQKLNGSGFTKSVLEHLKRWPGIAVPDSELDSDAGLFAVSNGVIDLYEGGFRSALPTDYLTMAGGCAFDPDATCPQYDALMDLYHPEKEMQDYLHRLAGAAMEGKQNLQNIVVWFGETAGNGKGTTERIWSRVFGTYARSIPVEVIASKGAYDQYRDEKAKLKGARLVFTTEPSEGMRFSSGTVNSLTGGDAITSRDRVHAPRGAGGGQDRSARSVLEGHHARLMNEEGPGGDPDPLPCNEPQHLGGYQWNLSTCSVTAAPPRSTAATRTGTRTCPATSTSWAPWSPTGSRSCRPTRAAW